MGKEKQTYTLHLTKEEISALFVSIKGTVEIIDKTVVEYQEIMLNLGDTEEDKETRAQFVQVLEDFEFVSEHIKPVHDQMLEVWADIEADEKEQKDDGLDLILRP